MAFADTINEKMRLDFSNAVESVVESDMSVFGADNRNDFLNIVIQNYYPYADASIVAKREEYWNRIYDILSIIHSDNPTVLKAYKFLQDKKNKPLIDALGIVLKNNKEIELKDKRDKIEKDFKRTGHSKPHSEAYIHKELFNYFTDGDGSQEEDVYKNLPEYFRAVIREYCQLPYLQREEIYHKDRYDIIHHAISNSHALKITTSNDDEWIARPYKIIRDPFQTAQYIAAYSYRKGADRSDSKASSFRISTLKDIRSYSSISGFISQSDKNALDRMIDERGIQYLLSDTEEIKVRLTKEGKDIFLHSINQRPSPVSPAWITDKDDIYTFRCSRRQASNYFFKFGKEAEIIEPADLRDEFKKKYLDSYSLYSSNEL